MRRRQIGTMLRLISFGLVGLALTPGISLLSMISTQPAFASPDPAIIASPNHDWVDGIDWPGPAAIDLIIDDDLNSGNGTLYEDSGFISAGDSWIGFELGGLFDLEAGHFVTLTDGTMTKVLQVSNLIVSAVDPGARQVSGTADAGTFVAVWFDDCGAGSDYVLAEPAWIATLPFEFCPGNWGSAAQYDDDGDMTMFPWYVPDPNLAAWPAEERVEGFDWAVGDWLELSIDDPGTLDPVDCYAEGEVGLAEWNPDESYINFDLWDIPCDLQAGFEVTLSDGTTTKEHTVTALTLTSIDAATSTATGTADAGTAVDAWACDEVDCANRHVIAEGGVWTANFGVPGVEEDEQYTIQLEPNSGAEAGQWDAAGNSTRVSGSVPNPHIEANLVSDWIAVHQFTGEATATLEVYEFEGGPMLPEFPQQIDTDPDGHGWLEGREFWADLQPGMVIIAIDDATLMSRSLILGDLTLDLFSPDGDLLAGTVRSPGPVWADVGNEFEGCGMEATIDGENWSAYFLGEPCFLDVTEDMGQSARVFDEDGDETVVELPPSPSIIAFPRDEHINGQNWPAGAEVSLVVSDALDGVLFTDSQISGYPDWDPWSTWVEFPIPLDIQTGHIINMDDGTTSKEHVITSLQVLGIDVEADTVFGTADPLYRVDLWTCDDLGCVNRHEDVALSGEWSADFQNPGDEPDEGEVYDFLPGSPVDATQWDEDGDATWVWFNAPDPRTQAWPLYEFVEGFDWPVDEYVDLVIDDDEDPGNGIKYSASAMVEVADWDPSLTWVGFELPEGVDLQPGDDITLSHGSTVKVHVVRDFAVTSVDVDADVLYGTADPGSLVRVNPHESWENELEVAADGSGNWMADFSGAVDIELGHGFGISQHDDDRDSTWIDWWVPGMVSGAVLLDEAGVPDVEVFLGIFGEPFEARFACTAADGSFEFANVPYDAGLISITGPSASEPGCSNVYFLDPEGVPMLIQAWDHYDMVEALTWFGLDPGNPELALQFDLTRAMASQIVMVTIGGEPAPDMTPVRAFDPSQIPGEITPDRYPEIFVGTEGRLAMAATGLPFGAGRTDLRYPEWLGELPPNILILAQYEAPNPGPVTVGQLVSADSFFDRGDGFLMGPPLCFGTCAPVQVTIDIKPGSEPGPINLGSMGKVPVAILSDAAFAAEWVEPSTVNFAGAVPITWSWEDIDEDGDLDLMLHFMTPELTDLNEGSTEAALTATIIYGAGIEGSDGVKIVPQ